MKDTVIVAPNSKFAIKSGLAAVFSFRQFDSHDDFFLHRVEQLLSFLQHGWNSAIDRGNRCAGARFDIRHRYRGIDLSVGTVMTLSAVMTGVFITMWGLPVWVGIIGGLLTGALCGLMSGLAISRMGIPPFIATLAMMMIAKGLALVISGTKPIYFTGTPVFMEISQGSLLGDLIPGFDIPNAVLIFFIAAVIGSILLARTIVGRYNFAIGQRRSNAPVRCQRPRLENRNLHNYRPFHGFSRHSDRFAPQLSSALAWFGL